MFIHVCKTTDFRSAATAILFSPMSIRPQREAHFASETEPRKVSDAYEPFSPCKPHTASSVWEITEEHDRLDPPNIDDDVAIVSLRITLDSNRRKLSSNRTSAQVANSAEQIIGRRCLHAR